MRTNVAPDGEGQRAPVTVRGKGSLSRKRITVGLTIASDAAFARSVPVFVVYRNPRRRQRPNSAAWRAVSVPAGVELRFQKRAWMDEELILDYLACLVAAWNAWDPPARHPPMCADGWVDERAPLVLVWDSFSAHLTDSVKDFCRAVNIRMVVIPGGLTALVQGLDTHINKSFKAECSAFWRARVLRLEDPTLAEMNHQDFLDMIKQAAANALAKRIPAGSAQCGGMNAGAASFLHNGLTNHVDGSQDAAISILHPKVDPAWRAAAPCVPPALDVGPAEADPGYGSEWSDGGDTDSEAGEAGCMRRIIASRDAAMAALESDAEAPAPQGSLWSSATHGPGTRRSSRPILLRVPWSPGASAAASSSRPVPGLAGLGSRQASSSSSLGSGGGAESAPEGTQSQKRPRLRVAAPARPAPKPKAAPTTGSASAGGAGRPG